MRPPKPRFAGWLPPIPSPAPGGALGWLPLKSSSVAAVFDAVVTSEHQPVGAPEAAALSASTPTEMLITAMKVDPALLLRSVAVHTDASSLNDLAQWWLRQGRVLWSQTDWLAAPEEPDNGPVLDRFGKLDDHFRTLPLRHWLGESDPWFENAGIANPITDSLKTRWRDADHQEDRYASGQNAHLVIARAVRDRNRSQLSERAFSDAVESSKRGLAHRLAYGLSHEINNPLANISTRAQTLVSQVSDMRVQESLQRIVEQTSRAHAMVADLMFYANPPQVNRSRFDLIERMKRVLISESRRSERLGIDLSLHVAGTEASEKTESWVVDGDAEMIGDAVSVLVRNSIEAIGADGHIRVEVKNDAGATQILVCDSGPGMTAEQAETAMDPFYSGREAGRGLGLGLCRAHRIAELHAGSLQLSPALAGCVATLSLPCAAL